MMNIYHNVLNSCCYQFSIRRSSIGLPFISTKALGIRSVKGGRSWYPSRRQKLELALTSAYSELKFIFHKTKSPTVTVKANGLLKSVIQFYEIET